MHNDNTERIQLLFDPSSPFFQPINELGRLRHGYWIAPEKLSMSSGVREALGALLSRYNESLNFDYPPTPGPWGCNEWTAFGVEVDRVLNMVQAEIEPDFEIVNGSGYWRDLKLWLKKAWLITLESSPVNTTFIGLLHYDIMSEAMLRLTQEIYDGYSADKSDALPAQGDAKSPHQERVMVISTMAPLSKIRSFVVINQPYDPEEYMTLPFILTHTGSSI